MSSWHAVQSHSCASRRAEAVTGGPIVLMLYVILCRGDYEDGLGCARTGKLVSECFNHGENAFNFLLCESVH